MIRITPPQSRTAPPGIGAAPLMFARVPPQSGLLPPQIEIALAQSSLPVLRRWWNTLTVGDTLRSQLRPPAWAIEAATTAEIEAASTEPDCPAMTTLYIIGNGFDIWHGLPTRYSQFYEFAKGTLDHAERYFRLGDSDCPWSDFEVAIGTYDWRELFDEWNFCEPTSESFRVSETYGLQDELADRADALHQSVEECFCDWIDQVDVHLATRKMTFDTGGRFISFNYTSTLQSVYGIEESHILHIHGRAECGDVIFGHGLDVVEEPELDENGDSNRSMFTDAENAAKYPLFAFRKPTSDIIQNHREYLESLCGVTRIEVIGHSLADVDLPYFKQLAAQNKCCSWTLYWFDEKEIPNMLQQMAKCDVDAAMILIKPYPSV